MPLVVVTGVLAGRVAQQMRDAVCSATRSGLGALLALPGDDDAVLAREAIAASVPVGVRVATLDGVIEAEWALAGDGRRIAKGLVREALLSRALVSAGVSPHPGRGSVALLGTLARLASPVSMRGAPTGLGRRVITAVAHYRNALAAHRLVEDTEACALLAKLAPPADVIAIDGFVCSPPILDTLAIGWSDAGATVYVSVPWIAGHDGTAASEPLVKRLLSAGGTVLGDADAPGARCQDLDRVTRELFTTAPPGAVGDAVRLAVADGEEAEARYIAGVVAALILDGEDPGEVVIAFADPSRHREWMRRALRDEGIAAVVEADRWAAEAPFGRALLQLSALAAGGGVREDASAFARNPFSGLSQEKADLADTEWRRSPGASGGGLLKGVGATGERRPA